MFSLLAPHVFHGPNPYAPVPVVVWGVRSDLTSCERSDQARRLCERHFPRLVVDDGQAVDRNPARSMACLLASWAKHALNEGGGFITEAGARMERTGRVSFWVGYHNAAVTQTAVRMATRVVSEAIKSPGSFPSHQLRRDYEWLLADCLKKHPDYQTRILMVAARERGIPVLSIAAGARIWQFGWGARGRLFFQVASNADGYVGAKAARVKVVSKDIFRGLGLPTPRAAVAVAPSDMDKAADTVGWPCVVKPADGSCGRGVTADVRSPEGLPSAFTFAKRHTAGPVLVEAQVPGEDHRLLVVRGKLAVAIRRERPVVEGNGSSSVGQLLAELNRPRVPCLAVSGYLRPVNPDAATLACLALQGLNLDDVPEKGRRVVLRSNANLSTGGTALDVTEAVHPEVRQQAELLANACEIAVAGIDYITSDVGRTASETGGGFIEINTNSGLCMVVAAGTSEAEIGSLVLGAHPGRVPVLMVIIDDALQDGVAHGLEEVSAELPGFGWVCRDRACLHRVPLSISDVATPYRFSALLKHRAVRLAMVVVSVDELYQSGVPADRFDMAVLCGVDLSPKWRRVVEAACNDVVSVTTADDVLERCRTFIQDVDKWDGSRLPADRVW